MDCIEARNLFPITERCVYLNNAAESPLNDGVKAGLEEFLSQLATAPQDKPTVREDVRPLLSDILGGRPDDYALIPSTAMGMGTVAAGYPWRAGDNVVVPGGEHWSNAFPWLLLKDRGVEVRVVPPEPDLRIDPERVRGAVDGNTRILACAAVRFDSGFRADLGELSAIAHAKGSLFAVDAIQAAGACPLDVLDDGVDIMAGAGFKWLLGMHGTGYLYVNETARERVGPVLPGMFAAEDDLNELRWLTGSRRYESGTLPYALFHAWKSGLNLVRALGVGTIWKRNLALTDRLLDGLEATELRVLTPREREAERSAIVVADAGNAGKNKALYRRLRDEGIVVTLRSGILRISPNFYNTEAEIDAFLETVRKPA